MQLSNIKNKRILLLNDARGVSNYGLDLGSKALIELLRMGGNYVETIPYVEFHRSTTTSLSDFTYKYVVRPYIKLFSSDSIVVPHSLDQYPQAIDAWNRSTNNYKRKIENQIENAEAVIFNAEGSCHRENFAARKGLFLLYLASIRGKKTLFMNGSITLRGHQSDVFGPVIEYVANHLDGFLLREMLSVDTVRGIAPAANAIYFPDSTFKYQSDLALQGSYSLCDKYFLVSASMSKPLGMFSPGSLPLGKVVDQLAKHFGRPIFLVKDAEDSYLANFARERSYQVFSENSVEKLFSLFRNASFLLSGRFHHLILATINGCPLIPMHTTSAKNAGFVQMLPQLEYSKKLINPTALLTSIEFIINQANTICSGSIRQDAAIALKEFSESQRRRIFEGLDL